MPRPLSWSAVLLSAASLACGAEPAPTTAAGDDGVGFEDAHDYGTDGWNGGTDYETGDPSDDISGGGDGGGAGGGDPDGGDGGAGGGDGTDGTDGSTDGSDGTDGSTDGTEEEPTSQCAPDEDLGFIRTTRIQRSTSGARSNLQVIDGIPEVLMESSTMGTTIGPDRLMQLTLPAGGILRISTTDSDLGSGRDPWLLALLDDCVPVTARACTSGGGACLGEVLTGSFSTTPSLAWTNESGADQTLYLLVDEDRSTTGGDFELTVDLR